MLRQLAALTRRVPAAGPKALALAVYAGRDGVHVMARETGEEGIACVDDAARALGLISHLYVATRNPALRSWAEGLLEFVLWMEDGHGMWHNFILDWEGRRNTDGPTSAPGVNFWQARATCALIDAVRLLELDSPHAAVTRALNRFAQAANVPSDVRALHVRAGLEFLQQRDDRELAVHVSRWCDEIVACRSGAMLMNSPDECGQPHLWGHIQEGVLADAAFLLGRDELLEIAIESAEAVFGDAIRCQFDTPSGSYDVQSAVFVMDRLAHWTGRAEYRRLALLSRQWFGGRNRAGVTIYNRATGRVHDGIDGARLSANHGAEAAVSAGLALLDDPQLLELAAGSPGPVQATISRLNSMATSARQSA